MNIEKKTVLVTGSTDGVGRLVARRLADQGARVLIHGRDRTRGEQLLKEIRVADRGSAAFLPADFSSLAEVRRLADIVRQDCDRLDILINNAGIGSGGSAGKRETSQDGHESPARIRFIPAARINPIFCYQCYLLHTLTGSWKIAHMHSSLFVWVVCAVCAPLFASG
jgi:NAD(P)-dependent dehydrogenase (short-subunit alcohol dehydrogenase family)